MLTLVGIALEELEEHCIHLQLLEAGGNDHFHQKASLELICLPRSSREDGGPWWVPAAPLVKACCTVTLLSSSPHYDN